MLSWNAAFAPMIATLQEGQQAIREQLRQMHEQEVIDWAALDVLQGSMSELGDQAEVLLAVMASQGADEAEMIAAQELVLFFTHSGLHMIMGLGQPKGEAEEGCGP